MSSSKLSVAPIAPTFTTVIQHYMQTSYSAFHSNRSRNMESGSVKKYGKWGRNTFTTFNNL